MNTCTVDGCEGAYLALGLCRLHYGRMRRAGTTDAPKAETLEERFWEKVDRRGPGDCWPWLGTVASSGYGHLVARPIVHLAHRLSYEINVGPIPEGLTIDHVRAVGCARTDCVNPAHLEPVTIAENLRRSDGFGGINARKVACPRGHEYDRVIKRSNGRGFYRSCSTCQLEHSRKRRALRKSREIRGEVAVIRGDSEAATGPRSDLQPSGVVLGAEGEK